MKQLTLSNKVARHINQRVRHSLIEVATLHDVADFIAHNHENCAQADSQVQVLNNILNDRLRFAMDDLDMMSNYLQKRVKTGEPKVKVREVDASGKKHDLQITTS